MQIPILKGIYTTDDRADYRTAYPRNLVPVPKAQGLSRGYLRPSEGLEVITSLGSPLAGDRGGIIWRGEHYRVMGSLLVRITASDEIIIIGDVGTDAMLVTFARGFDNLGIASNRNLFIYDGNTIQQNVDPDLGEVLDLIWIDGYYLTTDGEFLTVTELDNPLAVNLLKFGSSEIDPDPVVAVVKIRNEVIAVNRYSVETFDNVGGAADQFPFRRIEGAQLNRGAVGTHAACEFRQALAFVGSKIDETIAVWIGGNGTTRKISTREIDQILEEYTEQELSFISIETRLFKGHENLYIHLPNETLVFDANATEVLQTPVWYTLDSGNQERSRYRAFNYIYVHNKWYCGDPRSQNLCCMTDEHSHHYGQVIGWQFGTDIIFNETSGFIVHEIKLTGLTGRVALDVEPIIYTSHSLDGVTFSAERPKAVGERYDRVRKIIWHRLGETNYQRIQMFRGTSDAHIGIARIDAVFEALTY